MNVFKLLERNHILQGKIKLYEKLTLSLIRDDDNALQRNIKAVEYVDKQIKKIPNNCCKSHLKEIRKIITHFETENILKEIKKEE